MPSTKVEIAVGALAALGQDAESYASFFTADAEIVPIRSALEQSSYRGHEGARQMFADSQETWESLTGEVDAVQEAGNRLLMDARLRGRGRSSGAEVEMALWFIVEFRDDKISSMRTYFTRADAVAGLSEQSGL